MGKLLFAATLFILTLAGCRSTVDSALTTAFRSSPIPVKLELIVSGLNDPVFMTAPPKDTTRLFIVEQGGRIRIYDALRRTLLPTPFLDISPLITSGGERGLLALAFDPNYDANRQFYVYYTNINGDISIARCLSDSDDKNRGDTSQIVVLTIIPHPTFTNHNGGMLAFGPDGCLYSGIGDGGSEGDPANNAQNTTLLLGKILRLDPSTGEACTKLTANPFSASDRAAQIWSYGVRNPWRFSFDGDTLYIADVGQNAREEINIALGPFAGRGLNFGWRIMEGFSCFGSAANCSTTGLTLPLVEYSHTERACSIIGGYVYRGAAIPALVGTYFYADFCAGFVRSFVLQNEKPTQQFEWPTLNPGEFITSFGEDGKGELYLMTLHGNLWRIGPM